MENEKVWEVKISTETIKIAEGCFESDPCQHFVNGELTDGDSIWELIKPFGELRKTHPTLWSHFSQYEGY